MTFPTVLRLPGLTHLEVSNCAILGSGACILRCVHTMIKLRSLTLSMCGLNGCENAPAQHGVELAVLAEGLRHLSALQLLSFAHNPLTNSGLQVLMPSLVGLPLRSLVLRGCSLELGDDWAWGDPGISIACLSTLSRLDVSENSLRLPGHALGRGVLQLFRLKHLYLRDMQAVTKAQLCLLCELQKCQLGLVKFHMSKVSKAQPVLRTLQSCLTQCHSLQEIMLGFTQPLPLMSFVPVCTTSQKPLQRLQRLTLSRVSLCDDTVKLLIEGPKLLALTKLALKGVDGSQKGVSAFGSWIASCQALEVLVIETVQAGIMGGAVVAQALQGLQRLQQLRWHGLQLGYMSTGVLATSLRQCQGLQQLLLGGTGLGQQCWAEVMQVAGQLPVLRVLGVSDEDVGNAAVHELLQCLPRMTKLCQLTMQRCGLSFKQRTNLTCALPPCTRHSIK